MRIARRSAGARRRLLPWLAPLPVLLAGWLLHGCSSSTGPEDAPPRVSFAPAADTVRADQGGTINFSVSVTDLPDAQIRFVREDVILGTTANLSYQALDVGIDHLRAEVTGAGRSWQREWTIVVGNVDRPPVVVNLAVYDGRAPSTATVSWRRPAENAWPVPLTSYEVAARPNTPPTENTWQADRFTTVPVGPTLEVHDYGQADCPQIVPDAVLYLGVRTVDQEGRLSPVQAVGPYRVTRAWELTGVLTDEAGRPLGNVSIAYGTDTTGVYCDTCRVFTGTDGGFHLGPLRERDRFVLETRAGSAWFEYRTPVADIQTPMPLRLAVVARHPVLSACTGDPYYPGESAFLDLLRELTKTDRTWDNRKNYRLLKWDSYPVPVYVPEAWSDVGGFDLKLTTLSAIASWNERVGEPVLAPVAVPPEVGIEMVYRPGAPTLGIASVVEPSGYEINEVVPRKIRVTIEQNLYDPTVARGIAMHELGHALGLGWHSRCPAHLMNPAYTVGLEISDEEAEVMRAVRDLPQATPMDRYLR